MSSIFFSDFQKNFWIFCKLAVFVDIERSWYPFLSSAYSCRVANFSFSFFVFEKFEWHNYLPFNVKLLIAMHDVVLGVCVVALAGCHALGACWPDGRLTVSRLQSWALLFSCCFSYSYYTIIIVIVKGSTLIYFGFFRWLAGCLVLPFICLVKVRHITMAGHSICTVVCCVLF